MIDVHVVLPSGRCSTVSADVGSEGWEGWEVADLMRAAEVALGNIQLQALVSSIGRVLEPRQRLGELNFQQGETVTAVAAPARIFSNSWSLAFALLRGDGTVFSWGDPLPESAGNEPLLNDAELSGVFDAPANLKGVRKIEASHGAFAALLSTGDVVCWGDPLLGGDCRSVAANLTNIRELQASYCAFAATCQDGRVVTWGNSSCGGDSSKVKDQLIEIEEIAASCGAFAARKRDGSVVVWGHPRYGGDGRIVQRLLSGGLVRHISASSRAFAAITFSGNVVSWGHRAFGGDSQRVQGSLQNVKQICATWAAFLALRGDGTLVTWGAEFFGATALPELKNVEEVYSTGSAFAAVLQNRTVVTFGNPDGGGDSTAVQEQLKDVRGVASTESSFCALLGGGNVVTWGDPKTAARSHGSAQTPKTFTRCSPRQQTPPLFHPSRSCSLCLLPVGLGRRCQDDLTSFRGARQPSMQSNTWKTNLAATWSPWFSLHWWAEPRPQPCASYSSTRAAELH